MNQKSNERFYCIWERTILMWFIILTQNVIKNARAIFELAQIYYASNCSGSRFSSKTDWQTDKHLSKTIIFSIPCIWNVRKQSNSPNCPPYTMFYLHEKVIKKSICNTDCSSLFICLYFLLQGILWIILCYYMNNIILYIVRSLNEIRVWVCMNLFSTTFTQPDPLCFQSEPSRSPKIFSPTKF